MLALSIYGHLRPARASRLGASPLTAAQESELLDYITYPAPFGKLAQFKPELADGIKKVIQALVWAPNTNPPTSAAESLTGTAPAAGTTPNGGDLLASVSASTPLLVRKDFPSSAQAALAGTGSVEAVVVNDMATLTQLTGPDGAYAVVTPLAPVPKAAAATTSTSTIWLLGGAAVLGAIGIAYAVKRPAGGPPQRNPRRRHSNRTYML
jgi:hypothetical protein